MSESNCPCPAEKPSTSPSTQGAPSRTSSGPACSRSPGGSAGSSSRRARATWPPTTCRHARTSPHGASNGRAGRAMPLVRSSPSGVPAGRMKKPPTIASATACSRHQRSSGVGAGRRTTRGTVRRRSWVATCSVVAAPSLRTTRWRSRWRGRTPRARVAALASELWRRAAMASWLRVSGRPADGRERGVTVNRGARRYSPFEQARRDSCPSIRVGERCGGAGTPRPWCGCRRCASSTTAPSGCARSRRRPSRSARAGTPSAARSCRRRARRRRSPGPARTPRRGRRRRARARRCAGSARARPRGATSRAMRVERRPAPPARRRRRGWRRHSARSASRSSSARSRSPSDGRRASKPRARSQRRRRPAWPSASAPSPSRSQNVLRNACTKAEAPGRGRAARGLACRRRSGPRRRRLTRTSHDVYAG